jgi:hypothetical protein
MTDKKFQFCLEWQGGYHFFVRKKGPPLIRNYYSIWIRCHICASFIFLDCLLSVLHVGLVLAAAREEAWMGFTK